MKSVHNVGIGLLVSLALVTAATAQATPAPLAAPVAAPEATPATVRRMITIGGHKISFHITPAHAISDQRIAKHGPVIVLDAGGGLDASYWDSVVATLSKQTGYKIITYDRAGFGSSDVVPGPWSVKSATDDLSEGLRKLGVTKNVVLVSHSLAGEIATYLTRRHPQWFRGAVLVDANVPDYYTDGAIDSAIAMYAPIIAAVKAAPPSREGRQLLALSESFVPTSKAFHKVSWPHAVPVVVIVSEKTPLDAPAAAQWWRDAHAQFAKRAANRTLITADGSSHDVAHDRPDVILKAIMTFSRTDK